MLKARDVHMKLGVGFYPKLDVELIFRVLVRSGCPHTSLLLEKVNNKED